MTWANVHLQHAVLVYASSMYWLVITTYAVTVKLFHAHACNNYDGKKHIQTR